MENYMFSLFQREIIKKERAFTQLIAELGAARSGLHNQVIANQKLVEGILSALNNALEAKDPYTQGHSLRVSQMAALTAKSMGLSPKKCEQVRLAGLFHDIGKIGIPDSILFKKGRLTREEYEEICMHPVYSVKILEPVDPFHKVLLGVKHHHENWDGSGYPDRLRGDQIPLAASIIHVADSYDAMTSQRSYRQSISPSTAVKELICKSGEWYHPEAVEHFARVMRKQMHVGALPS